MPLPTSLTLPHGGVVRDLEPVARGAVGIVLRGVLAGRLVGVKIDEAEGGLGRLVEEAITRTIAGSGAPVDGTTVRLGRHVRPCLVFQWIEGAKPSAPESVEVVQRDVAASLARLHLLGFRHGDVKLENIVLTPDGARAALIDFGLCAPLDAPLTGATPENLPPEALSTPEGTLRIGAEADVFALGRALRALGGDELSAAGRLALSDRPGDRPSAAVLAGWEGTSVPLDAAYVVERRQELVRGAREGSSPPRGPAEAWTAGLMRAVAGLHERTARGAPLPPLDAPGLRRLLVRLVGAVARDWRVVGDEAALLSTLAERGHHRALGPTDLRDLALPALDPTSAIARLAVEPTDEEALAALALSSPPLELLPNVVTLLRRAGRLKDARRLAERWFEEAPSDASAWAAAELARMTGDRARARALLEGSSANAARALLSRLSLDAGDRAEAERLLPDEPSEIHALVAWSAGRFDDGLAACEVALGRAGDPERASRLLLVRGMLLHGRGDAASAARAFARSAEMAAAIGALPVEASARASAAAAAHDAGRLGEALDASARAIEVLERLGRGADAARARLTRAATLLCLGATTDAAIEAERAELAATRAGDLRAAAYAAFTQIDAAVARGRPAPAEARRARARLREPTSGEETLLVAYTLLSGESVEPERLRACVAGLAQVEPASARWTFFRARPSADDLDAIVRAPADEAPAAVVGPVLARAVELARRAGRGDAARTLAERLGRLVARLEEDLPIEHRASFAAQSWVEAARGGGRGEDLGLGEGQIELLSSIARGLRDRTSLGDLLRQVLDGLVLWVGVERGLLLLRAGDPDAPSGVRLVPRVARGLSREDLHGEQLALSTSLARRALETLEPVVAVDASGADAMSSSIHALRLRSVLAVPLVARGEALGVVYLDDRIRRGAFGPREVAWVRLLATQAAAAIADARDALRLRRLARRAQRAQARLESMLAQTEGALEVVRAELAGHKGKRSTRHPYVAIVGDGEAIRRTLALVDRVTDAADARIPVLVLGESGTGKELVARAIHDNGPRRKGPFVAENCGAIPEALLESTLFGHVRGAFTGADRPRVGLFEIAHGGTLLLDEIGEMSLAMQAKLLRVLQDSEIRPVGGERSTKVDVRVIGATHRDLATMVREGRFREDLYYRLAVLVIPLPPLRERTEDLPALVDHFVRRWAGARKIRVTRDALAVLSAASWPGNVRQLENELRRAMVLCDDVLDVEHLSPELLQPGRSGAATGLTLRDQLDALERRLVLDALRRAGGNQTHAAKALGISRFGLQKMTKRLGLPSKASTD